MRFNNPDDVKAWAEKVAAQDLERYRKYGYDLNPYCTPQARNDWRRGFKGWPPHTWESATTLDFCTKYQRGRAMARSSSGVTGSGRWCSRGPWVWPPSSPTS